MLQKNVDILSDWCVTNRMQLSAKKCSIVSYYKISIKIRFDYKIDSDTLARKRTWECFWTVGWHLRSTLPVTVGGLFLGSSREGQVSSMTLTLRRLSFAHQYALYWSTQVWFGRQALGSTQLRSSPSRSNFCCLLLGDLDGHHSDCPRIVPGSFWSTCSPSKIAES